LLETVSSSARQTDAAEIKTLKVQQTNLVAEILKTTMKREEKILALARLIERRYELGDFTKPITEICTTISRFFKESNPSLSAHINRYLPDKYKNPKQMRFSKLENMLDIMRERNHSGCDKIEQCSPDELLDLYEFEKAEKNRADDFVSEAKKQISYRNDRIERIQSRALDLGIKKLGDDKLRRPISERDYRYEIPAYFGFPELFAEWKMQWGRYTDACIRFGQKYLDCPPPIRHIIYRDCNIARVLANVMEAVNEDKWSGEDHFWFDREYWKDVQSSHMAGNSTYFPTTLCKFCSSNIKEDPQDFHRMKYWPPSPTGWLCDRCQGTECLTRDNTREQVADNQASILRDAADLLNHLPHYHLMILGYRDRAKNPAIYARKSAIASEFEDASMGKEKYVVPYREPVIE